MDLGKSSSHSNSGTKLAKQDGSLSVPHQHGYSSPTTVGSQHSKQTGDNGHGTTTTTTTASSTKRHSTRSPASSIKNTGIERQPDKDNNNNSGLHIPNGADIVNRPTVLARIPTSSSTSSDNSVGSSHSHAPSVKSPTDVTPVPTLGPFSNSRSLSGTYAPVRKPMTEANRSSSELHPHPSHGRFSNRRKDASNGNQYRYQEEAYLRQIKQHLDEDPFLRMGDTVSSLDLELEKDDDNSTSLLTGLSNDHHLSAKGEGDRRADLYLSLSYTRPSQADLNNPENRERLEWQAMLSSVLRGDVVRSEKQKLILTKSDNGSETSEEIWLQIKANACGRAPSVHEKIIQLGRMKIDKVVQDVLNFRIESPELSMDQYKVIIEDILSRVSTCEGLYSSLRAMRADKPAWGNEVFVKRVEALTSWMNLITSMGYHLANLRKRIGNDALDVTKPADINISAGTDDSPFIERALREVGFKELCELKMISSIMPLAIKAKKSVLTYSEDYKDMNIKKFLADLIRLVSMPLQFQREVIKTKLSYARKLSNPSTKLTVAKVEQMLDDIRMGIATACSAERLYKAYVAPEPGWMHYPRDLDNERAFENVLLDAIRLYFVILNRKILSKPRSIGNYAFKEADILDNEWSFFRDVVADSERCESEIAEQFCLLTSKVLGRLILYFDKQMAGPPIYTASELERWYFSTIETVRGIHRRVLRFSLILGNIFESCAEYNISPENFQSFIQNLSSTGHFLIIPSGQVELDGVYFIGSPDLWNRPERIRDILRVHLKIDNHMESSGSYILAICPPDPLIWADAICQTELPNLDMDIKQGCVRLITGCSSTALKTAKRALMDIFPQSYVLQNERVCSNDIKISRELDRMNKSFYRLAVSVFSGVDTVRWQCKELGLQDLTNNFFSFARDLGQRYLRHVSADRYSNLALKLIYLSVDWIAFICDECAPTDRGTFRWVMSALEFVVMMTNGVNILAIDDEQFLKLKTKVAGCMALLISHFSMHGRGMAPMTSEMSKNVTDMTAELRRYDMEKTDDAQLMQYISEERAALVQRIDDDRRRRSQELNSVGRILDDSNSETQFLMFLASSLSNVSFRWQQGRCLGGGTFGTVYAAMNLETGDVMAVKEIRMQDPNSMRQIVKSVKDEMTVLEMLSHPNIVKYFGVEVHREKVFIFMEYCEGGSLANLLEHGRIEDETVIQVYTLQMLQGLAYLHQSGIVHRDIKPENILLDHMGVIKFVDFGAAKVMAKRTARFSALGGVAAAAAAAANGENGDKPGPLNSMTGTPMYMAPEIITGVGKRRHGSVDIWSLGCCVLEMATGRRPWANLDNEWAIMYHVAAGHLPHLPTTDQLSEGGQKFLLQCFQPDPFARPSAAELINDPWIMEIRLQTLGDRTSSPFSGGIETVSSSAESSPQTMSNPATPQGQSNTIGGNSYFPANNADTKDSSTVTTTTAGTTTTTNNSNNNSNSLAGKAQQ